jgi:hypothetical protein
VPDSLPNCCFLDNRAPVAKFLVCFRIYIRITLHGAASESEGLQELPPSNPPSRGATCFTYADQVMAIWLFHQVEGHYTTSKRLSTGQRKARPYHWTRYFLASNQLAEHRLASEFSFYLGRPLKT